MYILFTYVNTRRPPAHARTLHTHTQYIHLSAYEFVQQAGIRGFNISNS